MSAEFAPSPYDEHNFLVNMDFLETIENENEEKGGLL